MENKIGRPLISLLICILISIVGSGAIAQGDGGRKKNRKETVVITQNRPPKNKIKRKKNSTIRKTDYPHVTESEQKNEEQAIKQNKDKAKQQTKGYINGYEWIDLGLTSGTKWATCNIGAPSPSDCGLYFAWGETTLKQSYTRKNSQTNKKKIADISGDPNYDAAYVHMGGSWRLPTKLEVEELKNECVWEWSKEGNKYGYKVIGPNKNSIFLPACGSRDGNKLVDIDIFGAYWTSSSDNKSNQHACYLCFSEPYCHVRSASRYQGYCIRAVSR